MRLVMAGGGTGGHLFPALALAEEFKRVEPKVEILFVGGKGGLEETVVPKHGYRLKLLNVSGVKRTRGIKRLKALYRAIRGTIKAVGILRRFKPDGVIGSGSYSSAPVVFAARLLGIKTAILEQNALPGLTNKVSGRIVDRIYIAFDAARQYFPPMRTVLTGNPIRRDLLVRLRTGKRRSPGSAFTIFVFGGSQGAKAINAAFVDAAEFLTDLWSGFRVIHQTGEQGYEQVKEAYQRKKLKVEVHRFIEDMATVYGGADLVICRAGATSIAEITAFGLASILVPYPFASDNHQEVNGRSLEEAGATVMITQDRRTGRVMADAVRELCTKPDKLAEVSEKAAKLARPEAAEKIAKDFLLLLGE